MNKAFEMSESELENMKASGCARSCASLFGAFHVAQHYVWILVGSVIGP
jgi:hypothetical protein